MPRGQSSVPLQWRNKITPCQVIKINIINEEYLYIRYPGDTITNINMQFMPDRYNLNIIRSKHQINPNEDHSLKTAKRRKEKNWPVFFKMSMSYGERKTKELGQSKGF